MHITEQHIGDVTVVRLLGALDALTAPIVDERLHSLIAANAVQLVLDLSELSYLASAGIRVLFTAMREARRQSGNLRFVGVQPLVARTLELVGVLPALNIYRDVPAAVDSFSQGS
jgi:anti-anti-sigma factor